jgi:peptidoglycan-associated lipoprotein
MMKLRQVAALALVALAAGACRKKEAPVVTPAPAVDSTAIRAAEQARRDSIAAAERARQEAEERARAAAVARAREALSNVIYFDYDSEQLTAESEDRLRTKATLLRANPSLQLRVEGHADARGSTEYNLALAQRRAETVRNFLANYGIEGERIQTLSYGEERPAVEGDDDSAYALNRRAEFALVGGQITTIPSEVR